MDLDRSIPSAGALNQSGLGGSKIFLIIAFLVSLDALYAILQEISRFGFHPGSIVFIVVTRGVAVVLLLAISPAPGLMGPIERVEVTSPEFTDRVRRHYGAQAAQLKIFGFEPLFYFGEAFSIVRVLLVAPGVMLYKMWNEGIPIMRYRGNKVLIANPVFGAEDQRAYARTTRQGVSFHSAFRDGTILVTRNYGVSTSHPQRVVVHALNANAGELWSAHLKGIESIETDANPVACQNSFEFYADLVNKEANVEG
ncbi:MAG TPA: hypothetical protein VME23_13750 [Terracidiphilus sp.]|nr:hypothetical protein [Terracidiphilus sp.]